VVIGAGFAGLSASASLGRKGYAVTVLEKNATPGGRARIFRDQGFVFDMGPSWYWMPEIFEEWFGTFGHTVSEHYDLKRLDPSYQVIFSLTDQWSIPAGIPALMELFEKVEKGAGARLRSFLAEAKQKYDLGMSDLVRGPSLNWLEFAKPRVISGMLSTTVLSSMRNHVRASFKDPRLQQLLEFPVLFLGASPQRTPALYSLMNYADMGLGTWYPMGGMGKIVDGMVAVAVEQGVQFQFGEPVLEILTSQDRATGVRTDKGTYMADVVVASADYHHVDQELLPEVQHSYSPSYWQERVMAPSSLLLYLGFDERLPNLQHHNLFFDGSLDLHASEIYDHPQWPTDPLMYICVPSKTDASVAPPEHENVFALIPIAPGLEDNPPIRARYQERILARLSQQVGFDVRSRMVYERSYCINDFTADYNAYRGNAYGLANTLRQTAVLKPSMKSKKVKGLYFAGQLTAPGPGVPPSLISGLVVADLVEKEMGVRLERTANGRKTTAPTT